MNYKILIADDEVEIIELLELYLEKDNFEIFKACDGNEAWNIISTSEVHIAIIDIMMPGIDGFQLIKKIRKEFNIPVIMLSAKNQDEDKILGLGLGADDYVTKPFNPLEVKARINAQIRRVYNMELPIINEKNNNIIEIGQIKLDTNGCSVIVINQNIPLTSVEYKILYLLMKNAGRVFTKKQIYESVWENNFFGDDNTVMVHISNLRDKIEVDSKHPIYLKTIRGLGYKFEKKVKVYEK